MKAKLTKYSSAASTPCTGRILELWAGGAPLNDVSNIHGQGYADLHFLIPETLRELRATPGNYDPRQGDFAVAGSVRIGFGFEQPGVTVKAGAGSFGARRFFLGYHPKQADPDTFGAFELASTDGFGPSRAARHGSAIAQASYALGSGVRGRVLGSAYAGRFDSAGVLRLDDIESGRVSRFATYDPKQGGYSSRVQLVAELFRQTEQDDPPTRWSVSPYVVLRSLELRSNFTGFLKSSEGDSLEQLNDATTVGLNAWYRRFLSLTSTHDSLEAGVSFRSDGIRQSQHRLSLINDRVTDDTATPGVDARVRAGNAAGYVDATLHPIRRVTLRGGVRADALGFLVQEQGGQARSAAGAQLSKRGSVEVIVAPGLKALGSYGEGFRSPQARSLGNGETTPFTRVVSYEAGVRYGDAPQGFSAAFAVFHTRLSDDLVFDQSTARNELTPGTARTGVTASLEARPSGWFISSTSFTFTRAAFISDGGTYREGDLLPYVPQLVMRSDLAFTPSLGRVAGKALGSHFGAAFTYFGRRPLPYSELGHDAMLVDARAELSLGVLRTGVEAWNVFDTDWYDGEFVFASKFSSGASLVPVRHVSVGPPRTLLWTLTLTV
ncbi:MAG: TonB-dependent receptor [Polyangiaceae bacterium]